MAVLNDQSINIEDEDSEEVLYDWGVDHVDLDFKTGIKKERT